MNDRIHPINSWLVAVADYVLGRLKARHEKKIGWNQEYSDLHHDDKAEPRRDIKAITKARLKAVRAEAAANLRAQGIDPRFMRKDGTERAEQHIETP